MPSNFGQWVAGLAATAVSLLVWYLHESGRHGPPWEVFSFIRPWL